MPNTNTVSPLGRSPSLADECKAIFGTEPVWRLRAARRKNVSVCTKESNGNFTECALIQRRMKYIKCCTPLKYHAFIKLIIHMHDACDLYNLMYVITACDAKPLQTCLV